MEQEVNMKIACLAIQTTESASRAFTRALKGHYENLKKLSENKNATKTKDKEKGGKMVKIKDLRKDGSKIEFIDMGKDEMKDFRKYARKYGVSYSMELNKETSTYFIYFKAKDGVLIDKAISEYVADKLLAAEKDKEAGIGEKLIVAKEKVGKQPKKVKNKEQIR